MATTTPWYLKNQYTTPSGTPGQTIAPGRPIRTSTPHRYETMSAAPARPAVPRTPTTPTMPAIPAVPRSGTRFTPQQERGVERALTNTLGSLGSGNAGRRPAAAPAGAGSLPGLSPTRGFAARYTPSQLTNVYQSPWTILPDVFRGIQTSSPGYQAMRDLGGDPLALYNVIKGSQGQLGGGAADFTNFMADLYKGMGTPGGKGFNARDMVNAIFNTTKTGADATSSLGQILGAGDMSQQVRTLFNLLRDVAGVGMNPLAASGYQSALAQAGDRYTNAQMSLPAGQTSTAVDWIRQNMPTLALR